MLGGPSFDPKHPAVAGGVDSIGRWRIHGFSLGSDCCSDALKGKGRMIGDLIPQVLMWTSCQ